MARKKSAKQLLREQDDTQRIRRIELESEYDELETYVKDIGIEEILPLTEKEEWVNEKIAQWKQLQPAIITGKYQDKEKIESIYQQKFVEFVRQLCPGVLEELKSFVPLFEKFFGDYKNKCFPFFDWFKVKTFDLNQSLNTYINSLIEHNLILEFRPYQHSKFRYDFKWSVNYVLFCFLYLVFASRENQNTNKILREALEAVRSNLVFGQHHPDLVKQYDETTIENFIQNESLKILELFIQKQENSYFALNAKRKIPELLKKAITDAEPDIVAFIELMISLLKWTKKHNLEKDWLLNYAYDFLRQFSDNPNLRVSEIQIGYLKVRSLVASPFEFKFEGWLPGDEEKERYEKRLKEDFESVLEGYFQSVNNNLQLEKKKKSTKPLDYDLIKPLIRKTVQKWSEEKIVEVDFGITNGSPTTRYFKRKVKYLKEELPKFEKFNLPYKA